ncbi:hypothetical protein L2729_11860 [Shewanella gelidimarina]|uniref:hypothetical protein n=1 Tax=Shewanella gelidimarina TaxID=56813 RepID=UPI00200F01C7|nr:hypothetical protein [Shewanella gelidimarina]MCL1058681.1 hypothetical protein [Shewanella gelidimarina]
MSVCSTNRAILVLESPWELDNEDSNRTSVLPFVEGIAKLAGNTEVFHANFYDKKSFEQALDCLCKRKFESTVVYIAAHGYKKKVGKVNIGDLMFMVGERSKQFNITGVMLGSCFVGENTTTIEVFIEGTNIKWCAGYASSSKWLEGTMIDCAILSRLSILNDDDFEDKDCIIEAFANAISPFSANFPIGWNYDNEQISLEDSMQFVVQQTGRGHKAKLVTEEVFAEQKEYLFDE